MGSGGGGGGGGGGSDNAFTPDRRQREIEESNRREAERQENEREDRRRAEQDRREREASKARAEAKRAEAKAKAEAKARIDAQKERARQKEIEARKPSPATNRDTPAAEKKREVGVRYTPVSTPDGGVKTEASIMKTSPRSGELARKTGVSPGDVMATVGTLPTVDRDTAAANIAGRTDVNVATLGDLARRARVGNTLSPIPTPGSVGLSTIGRKTAMSKLTSLAKDEPTIGAGGRVEYGTTIVSDPRGGISDVVPKTSKPSAKAAVEETKDEPVITPEITEEAEEEVASTDGAPTIVGRAKRRTRGKRSGLAGKTDEYGILVTT